MKVIEEQVIIHAPDKKRIYTTVGYPRQKPKGIVIFVHGLASTELWPPMLLGSWYFREHGYAYCRVNLYDWREGARTLMTSDLLQHARDTETVMRYLKRHGFSKIFAVGHSFGGLTLLQTDTTKLQAVSLWDISSFISYPPKKWMSKDPASAATYMKGGFELLMSKRYLKGIEEFPDELQLISQITTPTQICYAAGIGAPLIESSQRYYKKLQSKKELVRIPKASHSFTEEGVAKRLFERTRKWFDKY